eukprot:4324072-Pleurochrysis_carterae.AAC.1
MTEQLREFDDLCRYRAERHLSKYVSLTGANACNSFSGYAEAHEVTEAFIRLIAAIKRYIEPKSFAVDYQTSTVAAIRRSAKTMPTPQLKSQSWPQSLLILSRWRRRGRIIRIAAC